MIKVEKDILSEYDLKLLQGNLTSNLIPWTFNHNVAYGDGKMNYGFSINVYEDGVLENASLSLLLKDVYASLDIKELIRCRIGFIFYSGQKENEYHDPHVDFKFDHKTSLYYANTSDAPTVIYNEKYPTIAEKYTVQETILPTENTLITFDGLQYHSSSSPRKPGYRFVVTFNYR